MINANELRLGNYFHPNSISNGIRIPSTAIWYKVGAINNFGEIEVNDPHRKETLVFSTKEVEPIALTPELLEGCGLSKTLGELSIVGVSCAQFNFPSEFFSILTQDAKDRNLFHLNFHYVCDESNEEQNLKSVKYLHELQNLTYALTGQELSIKEPSKTIPA